MSTAPVNTSSRKKRREALWYVEVVSKKVGDTTGQETKRRDKSSLDEQWSNALSESERLRGRVELRPVTSDKRVEKTA